MSTAERYAVWNPALHITQETISPARAAEYLINNAHNRPLNQRVVDRYAEQLTRGMWMFNGVPILLTYDGKLIDGQHRLNAIVQSQVSMRAVVIRGIDEDAFKTVDTGKVRGAADMLGIMGFMNAHEIVGGARFLLLYDNGSFWAENVSRLDTSPTQQQVAEYVETHPEVVSVWKDLNDLFPDALRLASRSVAIFGLVLARRADAVKANEFFTELNTGLSDVTTSPARMLRETLINHRIKAKRKMNQDEAGALTVKALNAHFQDVPLKVLRWRTRGARKEQFPKFSPIKI